jgi:hypothetical protein
MLPHVIEIVLSGEGGVGVVAAEGGEILIEQLYNARIMRK